MNKLRELPSYTLRLAAVLGALLFVLMGAMGCAPTVKVEAPDKPIVINLNVRIEQEVRIQIESEVEEDFLENPHLFN